MAFVVVDFKAAFEVEVSMYHTNTEQSRPSRHYDMQRPDLVSALLPCRPTFKQLVSRLESMLRQNRLTKKRMGSAPAGTGCDTATPQSQG